jgi:hypothetical protein
MLHAQLLDQQASIGLTQEPNDLFLGVSLLHRSDLRLGLIGLLNYLLRISGGSAGLLQPRLEA